MLSCDLHFISIVAPPVRRHGMYIPQAVSMRRYVW